MAAITGTDQSPSERFERMISISPDDRIQDLSPTRGDDVEPEATEDGWISQPAGYEMSALFCDLPLLHDELQTKSSRAQDEVAELCRKYMTGEEVEIDELNSYGIPTLQRSKHIKFMRKNLKTYPEQYQAADASRPWMIYWALAGLAHIGEDVSSYRDSTITTLAPMQNPDGGFGGGHGQYSHSAASYASILSLAMVDGLELVDRKAMWNWLGSIKQGDGSFAVAVDGEIDIRGAYCNMVIHSLLNLPLELPSTSPARAAGLTTFTDGLGEWVGRCQTYEGGIGCAPDTEAHGAYAFCGLGCLALLDAPSRSVPRHLDPERLLSWLSARQAAPEGSFSGRTNKLVDACYSHWVGGCWALLGAALPGAGEAWRRDGLIRYTLSCSQNRSGGLRDKPSARPDGYHTAYSLAGLSAAQNRWTYRESNDQGSLSYGEEGIDLDAPYRWHAERPSPEEMRANAFDEQDRVGFVHPVFVIPPEAVNRTRRQYKNVVGFGRGMPLR